MSNTKKTFLLVFIFLLTLNICTIFANASSVGIVTTDDLNLRSGPSTSNTVIGRLTRNNELEILDQSGDWYKVRTKNNNIGWANKNYVSVTASTGAVSTGTVTANGLNLRNSASTTGGVICTLSKGTVVSILEQSGDWDKVKTDSGKIGWVFNKYISSGSSTTAAVTSISVGTVNVSSINLRSSACIGNNIIGGLPRGSKVEITGQDGNWYQVRTSAGKNGWVCKTFISLTGETVLRDGGNTVSRGGIRESDLATNIINCAKGYLGTRYIWGGNTPSGFDCSGFTKYVYQKFGITLNRVAADQAKQGTWVSKGNLSPGDLVFFDTNGGNNYINHVGIYIGGGSFVHCSSGQGKVVITTLSSGSYANYYMCARRFF